MTNVTSFTRPTKSEGITFRIPSDSAFKLRQEAEKKQISLNTLVNQILREFVEWHNFAKHSDLSYLSKSLFSAILNELTEERISQIAEDYVKREYKDLVLLLEDEFTLDTILELKENWARVSGMPYKYDLISSNTDDSSMKNQNMNENAITAHKFTIQHDMGAKYSLLLKEIDRFLFAKFHVKTNFETTDNTIIITIDQP
ncbi:hypothetical protein [Candidatus Nitrosocosmicus arcticus]|uniref:hypothetical protein n=1 Tax=Candidatus Nitrosocosmicus arcticus TaxID=2035267 RepID=UPI0011A69128|nr:hypothetical protein [Candidatus Nitrosocosmicus arcticus]